MTVSQATLSGMQLDMHELFNQLQKKCIQMPMKINEMKTILYSLYKNSGENVHMGLFLFIKNKLEMLEEEARKIKGWESWPHGGWFYHFSFFPSPENQINFKRQRIVRIYLNPSIGNFRVLTDIMRIIINEPEGTRGLAQCKFPIPQNEDERFLRADKFVVYISEKSSALPRIIAWVKQLPKDAFDKRAPLFTKKIRNGVGIGYPRFYSKNLEELIRKVTKSDVSIESYGDYMCTIIAVVLKEYADEHKFEVIDFGSMPDKECNKLESRTWNFVAQQANDDLRGSGIRLQ